MSEPHDHTALFFQWVAHSWQFITAFTVSVAGVAAWYMHQVFTTRKATEACRDELVEAFRRALREHEREEKERQEAYAGENRHEHREIKDDVRAIRNHLMRKSDD